MNNTQWNWGGRLPEGVIDDTEPTVPITAAECIALAKRVSELEPEYLASLSRLATDGLKTSENPDQRRDLLILLSFCQAQLVLNMVEAMDRGRERRNSARTQESSVSDALPYGSSD